MKKLILLLVLCIGLAYGEIRTIRRVTCPDIIKDEDKHISAYMGNINNYIKEHEAKGWSLVDIKLWWFVPVFIFEKEVKK